MKKPKLLYNILGIIPFLMFSLTGLSQQIRISGVVYDSKSNSPLSGATISVKNRSTSTITSTDGEYEITVPGGKPVLVVSFVGYQTQEIPVGGKSVLDIHLSSSGGELNEVVVTALGIKKQKIALGYAVQEVKGEDLVKAREPNAINSLSGKVAGLTITTPTGLFKSPGIYLRGVNPLIVVDGVPISSDSWNLSPDDIAEYTVLKGPAAAALYGSQGQNGAILITTKTGTGNKRGISVEFNSSTQFQLGFVAFPERQQEYGPGDDFQYAFVDGKGGGINDADYDVWGPRFEGQPITQWNSPVDPTTGKLVPLPFLDRGPNNLKNFLQEGLLSTNNISLSGTNDNGNYRLSVSQLFQQGVVPNTKLGGTNVNFSGTLKLNKRWQVETSINYDKQYTPNFPDATYQPSSPIYTLTLWTGADYDVRDLRNYWQPGKVGTQQRNVELYQYNNPYFTAYQALHGYDKDDIYGHIKLMFNINDHWNAFFRTSVSTWNTRQSQRYPISNSAYDGDGGYFMVGGYNQSTENFWDNNTDLLLNYKNEFGKNFSLNASGGANLRTTTDNYFYAHTNNGILIPQLFTVQNSVNPPSATDTSNIRQVKSVYVSADLAYKSILFLNLTGREDQSSTLPTSQNAYFYPSAALSGVISNMVTLPKAISFWKLRAAYARVGGDFVTPGGLAEYNLSPTYSVGTRWNNNPSETYSNTVYDPGIQPSFSTSYEAGSDLRFLNNRIGLDISAFKTFDGPQIFSLPISLATGYSAHQINGLTTDRRGLEITLTASPLKSSKGLNWDVLINWSAYQKYLDKVYDTLTTYNRIKVGQRMDQIFITEYQTSPDGKLVYGQNGLPISNNYPSMAGYSNNDWAASMINTFRYRSFTFRFQVDGRYGGKLVNSLDENLWRAGNKVESANQYRLADWENRDNPDYKGTYVGNGVAVTSGSLQTDGNGNVLSDTRKFTPNTNPAIWQSIGSSYFASAAENLDNRSYLKLREIVLTYQFPQKMISNLKIFHSGSVSAVGRNLLYLAGHGVRDIDVDQWITSGTDLEMPSSRSVGVNINLVF